MRVVSYPSKYGPICVRQVSSSAVSSGLRLAYKLHEPPKNAPEVADSPPIIFMHGLFGSKQNNRSISKALARDLRRPVFAIDLRNHGESPHDPQHNYTLMAKDVEGFMDSHNIKRATLIGHSMGAKTAMTMALRSPHLVESLIPVDNAPIDATLMSYFHAYIQGMREIEEAGVKKQADADEILQSYEESLPIRQFLLTNLVRDKETGVYKFRLPIRTLAASLGHLGDFPFKDPDEARYEGPTLFIRGTKSHYIADEALPIIGRFFPRFQLRDIDSGHWVISEQPEAFRQAVVEFLQLKN